MTSDSLRNDRDVAAVRFCKLARDGEAQAAALDAAAFALAASAEKEIEDRLALFGWHARTRIDDLDDGFAGGVRAANASLHRNAAAGRSELDRVADEIIHDRAQLFRIGLDHRRLGIDDEPQAFGLRRELVRPCRLVDQDIEHD